jgi:hypothetical protein
VKQLREIVEGHFKYDYLRNDPECRSVDEVLEEKARQQKPTVSREVAQEIGREMIEDYHEMGFNVTSILVKRLKEIGVEVDDE